MNTKPTAQQIESICLSYRHDFGLMSDEEKLSVIEEANRWWAAISKEVNEPSSDSLRGN